MVSVRDQRYILIHPSFKDFGGAERKIVALHDYLSVNGCVVKIWSIKKSNIDKFVNNNGKQSINVHNSWKLLLQEIFSAKTHIILSNHPIQIYLLPFLLIRSLFCNVNLTWICNEVPFKNRNFIKRYLFIILTKLFIKILHPKVIANSENTFNDMASYYGCSSQVVYPGLKQSSYSGLGEKPKSVRFSKYILILGRISIDKNFGIITKLLATYPELRFIVAGARTVTSKHVESSLVGSSEHINFIYNISFDEKVWLLKNCAFGCFLSENEPFGVVPLEFLAVGKNVTVFDTCGVAKVDSIRSEVVTVSSLSDLKVEVKRMWLSGNTNANLPPEFNENVMCQRIIEYK